jgi:Flp pilus assembly protein TadD
LSFFELLIDLDLLQETITVAQKAISLRDCDYELHTMLGKALKNDLRLNEAAVAFYNAVMLKPEDINIRRQLAECLEEIVNGMKLMAKSMF